MIRILSFFCLIAIAFILSGCPDDNPSKPDDNTNVGGMKEFIVNSTTQVSFKIDSLGIVINLPNGGNGVLKVGSVKRDDISLENHRDFYVEFSGNSLIQLVIPNDTSSYDGIMYYGMPQGAYHKNEKNPQWWSLLPSKTTNDSVFFDIVPQKPLKKTSETLQVYQPPKANYFSYYLIKPNSSSYDKYTLVKHTILETSKLWLNNLPTTISDDLKKKMGDEYLFRIYSASSSSYQAFDNYLFGKNSIFNLRDDAELDVIAHETGHYMTHVMGGYTRFMEIYNQMPQDWIGSSVEHEMGYKYKNRSCFLEEYAYLSQFLAEGNVYKWDIFNSNFNMCWTVPLKTDNFGGYDNAQPMKNTPSTVDWPSIEGFAMSCVGALNRDASKAKIFKWDEKDKTNPLTVPTLDVPMKDIVEHLFYPCPKTFNEFHTLIEKYLNNYRGGSMKGIEKFYANMEPLGWSYNGKIKITDKKGNLVKKIKAIDNYIVIDKNEKYLSGGPLLYNEETGIYRMPRLFPGQSILRVQYDNNGKIEEEDFEINVNPREPTNITVDLGTIEINLGNVEETFKKFNIYLTAACTETSTCKVDGKDEVYTKSSNITISTPNDSGFVLIKNGDTYTSKLDYELKTDLVLYKTSGNATITINKDGTITVSMNFVEENYSRANASDAWKLSTTATSSFTTKPITYKIVYQDSKQKYLQVKPAKSFIENLSYFRKNNCDNVYSDYKDDDKCWISLTLYY